MGQMKHKDLQWGEQLFPATGPYQGQSLLERMLRIEKKAPLDIPTLPEVGAAIATPFKAVGRAYSKAASAPTPSPRFEPQFPTGGVPSMPYTLTGTGIAPPPAAPVDPFGDKGFRSAGEGKWEVRGRGATPTTNTISLSPGGTRPTTEAALASLRQGQYPSGVPIDELYKQAAARPQTIGTGEDAYEIPTTAPGASERALQQLQNLGLAPGGRAFEEEKMRLPARVADITARSGLAQQQEQSRGALNVAREQQLGAGSRAQAMMDLYETLGGAPGGANRSISISGAGSIGAAPQPRQVQQGLLRDVTTARANLERELGRTFGGNPEQAMTVYRQALGQVFAQDQSDPEVQALAMSIALNPETMGLTLNQLLTEGDFSDFNIDLRDPNVQRDLNRLLNYSRGIVGQ